MVWRLDRLGRSLKYLIEVVTDLEVREIGFQSLTEQIDTTTPGGKLIFHVFGALAEFERDLIWERPSARLAILRRGGHVGGGHADFHAGDGQPAAPCGLGSNRLRSQERRSHLVQF